MKTEFAAGWRTLTGAFLGIGVGASSLYFYSLGVFIKPLAATYGWSRGDASLGALVGTGAAAAMAILAGRLVDRLGARRVGLVSLVLFALSLFGMAWFTQGLTSFLVMTAILSILGAGTTPLPFTRMVVAAFSQSRGLALGIALAGTGVGALLIPALLPGYVAVNGWRAGYVALGVAVLVVTPLFALLTRGDQALALPAVAAPSLGPILASPVFRLMGVVFFLASVAVLGTVVQFVPMLSDAGMTPQAAGGFAAMIGLAALASRVLAGKALDIVPAPLVAAALFGVASAGLVMLAVGGPGFALAGALILGVAIGTEVDLIAFLVSRHFPQAVYGTAYGALYTVFLLGGAVGPALSGYLHDATGSYRVSLLVAAGLLAAAAMLAPFITRAGAARAATA